MWYGKCYQKWKVNFNFKEFIDGLEYKQDIYEDYKKKLSLHNSKVQKGKTIPPIQRDKFSKSKIGRRHMYKNENDVFVKPEYIEYYQSLGYSFGRSQRVKDILKESSIKAGKLGRKSTFKGRMMPQSAKRAIGEANSGGIYVYKDKITRHIELDELDSYLSRGWVRGNYNNITKRGKYIWISNGVDKPIQILRAKFNVYKNRGYHKGRK